MNRQARDRDVHVGAFKAVDPSRLRGSIFATAGISIPPQPAYPYTPSAHTGPGEGCAQAPPFEPP